MSSLPSGPALMIHLLVVAMLNAIFMPMIYQWSASILYTFLISVAVLTGYGVLVSGLMHKKRK